ncbi:mycofactocin biosynthesis chaperone MftB [Yinghuangia sp. ASG 101]|uniref:mycofactocin biosynthesis chaperone MftB n=1 Tax=Yinghuangia sp. ASG 101 TaxID=2896848 RepID=UPI001E35F72F|nr:mycofactocin biosynthesis chaperone MftB [Yinghuangia sp. ASG 101]UGQ12660.1 mycofactocin biosynthesis chaperone MftB [Yinghuangia sp. ASG 101]
MSPRPSGPTGPDGAVAPTETPEPRRGSGASDPEHRPATAGRPTGTPHGNGTSAPPRDDAGERGTDAAAPAGPDRPARPGIDLDRPWALHPQVSLRPEPFGALLYHFGTRRLTFLKDRRLVEVVRRLPDAPTARAACDGCGIPTDELPRFRAALAALAASAMLVEST